MTKNKSKISGGEDIPLKDRWNNLSRNQKIIIAVVVLVVVIVLIFIFAKPHKKDGYLLNQPRSDPQSKEDVNWSVPKEVDRILRRQERNLNALVRI